MKVNVYIPTLNAGDKWEEAVSMLRSQSYPIQKTIIIDSGSKDDTLSDEYVGGFDIIHIDKKDFDHGGTRHMAIEQFPDADIYLFLTQDAILADTRAISTIIKAFDDNEKLGMVYGRQLPHKGAKELESHLRIFNYPALSQVRGLEDAPKYGIKTISCSNSFAAYRREAYWEAGGFPAGTILGEDVIIAGQMLLKGWQKAYLAEAAVYHSHNYSLKEEFKRYFDIGVFHATNPWIFTHFGRAESEGMKYLKSEMEFLLAHNKWMIPKSLLSILCKWLGYKFGLKHDKLPPSMNRYFSMHKAYWSR
ncbi:MAG TPA: glycosyltransferase [Cyclobacteriaceae bacterium]|nr:glycosyltransferase [Cyclobacteriaceae bacterium]